MKKTDKIKIYLANPYGFSTQQKNVLLPEIIRKIKSISERIEVWEPFARNNQIDFSNPDWAYDVGKADREDVMNCDAVFAIVNGTPPDEGVAVELGIAIALNKPTFLFRDDFRKCTDSGKYPLNLMLFTGIPKEDWNRYYFTDIDQITDPTKELVRWVRRRNNGCSR